MLEVNRLVEHKLAQVPHTWVSGCSRRTAHPGLHIRLPTLAENGTKIRVKNI